MILVKPSFKILASSVCSGIFQYTYHKWGWKKLIEVAGRTCYKSEEKITEDSSEKFFEFIKKIGHHSVLEHSWFVKEISFFLFIKTLFKNPHFLYLKWIKWNKWIVAGNWRALFEFNPILLDKKDYPITLEEIYKYPKLGAMTVKLIVDRGVTHEQVRHRPDISYSQESSRYVNYKGGCTFVIPPWCRNIPCGEFNDDQIAADETLSTTASESIWFTSMLDAEKKYIQLVREGWTPQQARSVLPNSTKTEIVITANFREWKHIFNLRCAKTAHPQMQEIMRPLLKECQTLMPELFKNVYYEE